MGHTYWCAHSLGDDSYTDYYVFDNSPVLARQETYVTDLFTERALEFLEQHGAGPEPFCLSVHYTAPHAPWRREEQPAAIWDRYDGRDFPSLPVDPPHPWRGWDPTPEKRHETIAGYFTTITAMDAGIGRILGKLDEQGTTDQTLVIFTSDNGYNMGHHGSHGKGNGTFPKNMYEESVKVPFIARRPGSVPAGVLNTDLVSHYDFMPTILDYAGVENRVRRDLPGRSFSVMLRGDTGGHDAVVVCDESRLGVTGKGQTDRVGPEGGGRISFESG